MRRRRRFLSLYATPLAWVSAWSAGASGTQIAWGATGTLGTAGLFPYPSGITAGMGLLLGGFANDSTAATISAPAGWTQVGTTVGYSGGKKKVGLFFKAAAGSETGNLDVSALWVGDTALEGLIMRTTSAVSGFEAGASTNNVTADTSIPLTAVTTTGTLELAVSFIALVGPTTIAASTGETGGDWTEPAAEQTATGSYEFQVATMAAAGTITGGSAAIGASLLNRISISCALKP